MKKVIISTLLSMAILGGSAVAKDLKITTSSTLKETKDKAIINAKKHEQDSKIKIVQEALDSLNLAAKTLKDLDAKDTKSAKKDLEKALGKLEVILSAKDAPKELPISSIITTKEFIGTVDDAKSAIKAAKEAIDDKKIQLAREILNTLQSEIDVTVTSLPLATYPDALKLAARYLQDGKVEKAKYVLELALNTFNTTTHIIPIPLLKSASLLGVSQELAKDGKKDEAIKFLDAAQDELDIAKELGYVSHSDTTYESMRKAIKEIKKEIKGKNEAQKLFDALKEKLKDFKDKIFSEKQEKNRAKG